MNPPHGFLLGVQYYRPPFPRPPAWSQDLCRIRDAGFDAVVAWVVWGWCEPEPGVYAFDNYDRLFDLAHDRGLGVVLSVLPELNPFWVPRVMPDAAMIDVHGRPVVCGPRLECLSGLVPGGCSDHPGMRARMERFLETCGAHFAHRPNLLAWDAWNENRWRNGVDESVCFCPHSLASFRAFLRQTYGTLEALGEAWGRRCASWDDVRVGPRQANCYPEQHDFTRWLCRRAQEMARWRIEAIRRGDPHHPVGSHTSSPTICGGFALQEDLFARGIDRDVAQGSFYGLSIFPDLQPDRPLPPESIAVRLAAGVSAAAPAPCWLSELQGGPAVMSGHYGPPLDPQRQQAWLWLTIAHGLPAALLWCWRPEVFGGESTGFGVTAPDGLAEARLQAIRQMIDQLERAGVRAGGFSPDPPEVAVVFQRDAYWINWMQSRSYAQRPYDAPQRLLAYCCALEHLHIPYVILDDRHPQEWARFAHLRLVLVPDAATLADPAAAELARFVERGGVVWCEETPGSIGPDTFIRENGDQPLSRAWGLRESCLRRPASRIRTIPAGALGNAEPIDVHVGGREAGYACDAQPPVKVGPDGFPMLVDLPIGRGRAFVIGSAIGGPTWREAPASLLAVLQGLLSVAGVARRVELTPDLANWCAARLGRVGDQRALVLVNFGESRRLVVRLRDGRRPPIHLRDVLGGCVRLAPGRDAHEYELTLELDRHGRAMLQWSEAPAEADAARAIESRVEANIRDTLSIG